MARSWLLAHLILALLIEDVTGELLDSPPVRHVGPHRPVSLWHLHGMLRSALVGTVLRTFVIKELGLAASTVWRHLCDPPRRRRNKASAARLAA